MPIASRGSQSIAAGASFSPDLGVYDRMGGGGGRFQVRAVVDATAGNLAGDIVETLFIGSELVENRGGLPLERTVGAGPDNFTPTAGGLGAPGDKVQLTFTNVAAGARIVRWIAEVENA